jgi:hypothetical protein
MITRLGEISLAAAVPLLAEFQAALSLSSSIALPDLEAKIGGLGGVLAAITVAPPALVATIEAALETLASLEAAIGGPTVTLQATAIIALLAELNASLDALTAGLAISIPSAVLSAYVYSGPSALIGVELQSSINASLPGVGGHCDALILATADRPAWAAASLVFRVA